MHYCTDLQFMPRFYYYDNIAQTQNVSECLYMPGLTYSDTHSHRLSTHIHNSLMAFSSCTCARWLPLDFLPLLVLILCILL